MDYVRVNADLRLTESCAYCGEPGTTDDHVPPRVFLDDPLPNHYPQVRACRECNLTASLDEEYVACLLDTIVSGSSDPDRVGRKKVARILRKKATIRDRIGEQPYFGQPITSRTQDGQGTLQGIEESRVCRVLRKMAQGHVAYELAERVFDEPVHFHAASREMLTDAEIEAFEIEPALRSADDVVLPELGSAAAYRHLIVQGDGRALVQVPGWQDVQQGRYRYMVLWEGTEVAVRMVLNEFLFCEAIWRR